jgi:hypothetical protein
MSGHSAAAAETNSLSEVAGQFVEIGVGEPVKAVAESVDDTVNVVADVLPFVKSDGKTEAPAAGGGDHHHDSHAH